MKLVTLQIQGARKIVAAQIDINSKGVTEIKGKNRQGKTTVIDTAAILLLGKDRFHKAMVNAKVGKLKLLGKTDNGYIIKRTFTDKSDTLVIEMEVDGGKMTVSSPQKFLNGLISYIAIEPKKFINATPKAKKDLLLKESGIDFGAIDKNIKTKETERRDIGRDIKEFGSPELPVIPEDAKRIDVAEENKKKNEILESNKEAQAKFDAEVNLAMRAIDIHNKIANSIDELFSATKDFENNLSEELSISKNHREIIGNSYAKEPNEELIRLIEKQILHQQGLLNDIKVFKQMEYTEHGVPEVVLDTTEELDKKINNAAEHNKLFDNYDEISGILERKQKKQNEYDNLTKEIDNLKDQKKAKLKEADLGIENLMVEEDGIYVDGIFSEDWSGMEQLKYAIMLGLKRSKLRCVAIDSYDSFDPNSKKEFEAWLDENDVQAIVTTAGEIPENMNDKIWYIDEGKILNHSQISIEELNKQSEAAQAKHKEKAEASKKHDTEVHEKFEKKMSISRDENKIEGNVSSTPTDFIDLDDDDF